MKYNIHINNDDNYATPPELYNELTEFKLNGPQPEYFVVTQETIDELKNTKVLNPTATPIRK